LLLLLSLLLSASEEEVSVGTFVAYLCRHDATLELHLLRTSSMFCNVPVTMVRIPTFGSLFFLVCAAAADFCCCCFATGSYTNSQCQVLYLVHSERQELAIDDG
jgi:hypothetical protein